MNILLVDNHIATQKACQQLFAEHAVMIAPTAAEALTAAVEQRPDLVILELGLASHSGMEFLYEFSTYSDWRDVPVILYTHVKLHDEVLKSRAFEQLRVKVRAHIHK
jgi:DNA-binding response OmpR family regulator